MSINFYFKFSTNNFMRQPNPERGYLWIFKKIIHEHLWHIDGHFWRKKQKTFLSKHCVMRQPNPERGYLWIFKKNNSWTFMAHWWTFLTKKTKDIFVETLRHAPAQPRKGLFMDIQKKYFMNIYGSLMDIFDQKHIHLWLPQARSTAECQMSETFVHSSGISSHYYSSYLI